MEFNFNDKNFKIIVISAVSTVVLGVGGYFAYQKFFNKPVVPQQVEKTTDTTTDETEAKPTEEEKKDVKNVGEFNEDMKEIIDSLSTNYVQSFDAVIKGVEGYDVIQEKTLIESKTARKFGLNSLSKVQIEYLYNQNDVESMTQDNKQTEEVKESEGEGEEADTEGTKKEEKKVEIKIEQNGKKEGAYNGIKGDFDGKINGLFKFTNKHADQSKNEDTSIKLIANFAGNEEKEDTSIERFSLTTKNGEIEELSRLDDYIFAKKNLTLANENQLMKKLSGYKVATSLRGFIEGLKEANIFNISKEPIAQEETKETETKDTETSSTKENKDTETKDTETKDSKDTEVKTEENKDTEETKSTDELSKVEESKEVEATKIESSGTGSNEVEMKEDAKPVEEGKVEENVEVKKDEATTTSTDTEENKDKEETTGEISQVDTNTEEVKYYVSLNKEEFKAFFDGKYKEIDSVLKLFGVETAGLQDSDYENAKLDGEIVKKGKDVVFTINSFTLGKNTITGTITNTEMNLTINGNQYKITTGNNLTVTIHKKENNEHTTIRFTNPKDKAGLFIQMKTTAGKGLKKYVTTTKIQSLQTKGNEKLPALFKESDKSTAQIKLNQIITDYSKILHKVSDSFIQESKNSNNQNNTNKQQNTTQKSNTQTNTTKKQDTTSNTQANKTNESKNTKDTKNTKPTK